MVGLNGVLLGRHCLALGFLSVWWRRLWSVRRMRSFVWCGMENAQRLFNKHVVSDKRISSRRTSSFYAWRHLLPASRRKLKKVIGDLWELHIRAQAYFICFFADDLFLFADSSCLQVKVIRKRLDDFVGASGQRINLEKSKLFFLSNFDKVDAERIGKEARIPITDDLGLIWVLCWSIAVMEKPCIHN